MADGFDDGNTGAAISDGPEQGPAPEMSLTTSQVTGEKFRDLLDFVFLAAALGVIALAAIRLSGLSPDPDIWWHVRTGTWILQNGTVPHADAFSSTTMGKPWIAYTWLFDLLTAKLFGAMANGGILLMTGGLRLLSMAALTALLARYTYLVRAMLLSATAHLAMLPLATPRPWLFTILFFIVELWLLLQACECSKREWLYPIVPLMILWANVHIQFVYGLGLLGLFALHQSIPAADPEVYPAPEKGGKLSAVWLWIVLAAASLVTLANPYGWRLYIVAYEYATQRAAVDLIQEMRAPAFRGVADWLVLILVSLAWFALGSARRKPLLLVALLIAGCWCGFRSARDVWFALIPASVVLARWLQPAGPRRVLGWKGWTAALVLASAASVYGLGASNALARKRIPELYPEKACDFVDSHHLPGPLYNSYNWGGYLVWRLPGMPVSIDGRANLYGDNRLTRSANTMRGTEDWSKDQELMRAKTVLFERDAALTTILRTRSDFRVLYEDKVAVVFQRVP